jgi:NADP-dependent aldehyde dehydrogenase
MTTSIDASRFFSIDARTGLPTGEAFPEDDAASIAAAAARALAAFPGFARTPDRVRAELLRDLAVALEAKRDALVLLGDRETALGPARLQGEIDRTAFQLRAFADYVQSAQYRRTQRDAALPGPPPAGRPALIRTFIPIGPVAVFAPSNFPFAFSVLGGDTASALAAGNPVVVKAHPAHPALSRATIQLAHEVLARHGLPEDVLQMVQGASHAVGIALVTNPAIAAVGFTGSLSGGRALQQAINTRDVPIPFFGELSSINPIVAFPSALAAASTDLAAKLAGSIALGSGQFCTSPGVLLLVEHPASRAFVGHLATALNQTTTHPMLTRGIREQFDQRLRSVLAIRTAVLRAGGPSDGIAPTPTLIEVVPEEFLRSESLRHEVFGPCCIVVVARDSAQLSEALDAIGGTLTVTVWAGAGDAESAAPAIEHAMLISGRLLIGGVPTGVAVAPAQQHGGPWPSSSRPDTTSVGLAAINRFMRPIAIQDAALADEWLPATVREAIAALPTSA